VAAATISGRYRFGTTLSGNTIPTEARLSIVAATDVRPHP
jgi:hypothetical protein